MDKKNTCYSAVAFAYYSVLAFIAAFLLFAVYAYLCFNPIDALDFTHISEEASARYAIDMVGWPKARVLVEMSDWAYKTKNQEHGTNVILNVPICLSSNKWQMIHKQALETSSVMAKVAAKYIDCFDEEYEAGSVDWRILQGQNRISLDFECLGLHQESDFAEYLKTPICTALNSDECGMFDNVKQTADLEITRQLLNESYCWAVFLDRYVGICLNPGSSRSVSFLVVEFDENGFVVRQYVRSHGLLDG